MRLRAQISFYLREKSLKRLSFGSAVACAAVTAGTALAQVPASADAGKVRQRFEPAPAMEMRSHQPAVEMPSSAPKSQIAIAPFMLKQVSLEGNTVYGAGKLAKLYPEYIGQNIGSAEAEEIAARITKRYRERGYILSQAVVTGVDTAQGTLKIRVIEGYIANVIIEGEVRQNDKRHLIETTATKIKAERPLNIKKLERYLLLLDDLPGASARAVVRPSATTYGAADLIISMTHKIWEGSLTTNNRGSEYIGPFQHVFTLAANSLLGGYERTLFRYITASPADELQFFELQNEEEITEEGTRLNFLISQTRTEPSVRPLLPDLDGRSDFLQARLSTPLVRSRKENLTPRLTFDYRNSSTDIFGLELNEDRIRALRAGASYDFADWLGGVMLIDAEISQGLNIMNASDKFRNTTRPDADGQFTKFNLDISRIHPLPYNFSLFAAASGQFATSRLLSAEQFALGGVNFGTAYDPAELSGDHGVAGKVELRYGQALDMRYFSSYQLFGYYDIGSVWQQGSGNGGRTSLASTGLGVRANFTPWLSGSAEVGVPLTKKVTAEDDHDPRYFFSVTGRF